MGDKRYGTRSYGWAAGQKVSYTGTDADTTAFEFDTEVVVCATTDCFISVGAAPSAGPAAGSLILPASTLFHIQVKAGDKISFEQVSAGGDAYVMPC